MEDIKKYLLENFNKVKINSSDIITGDIFVALLGSKQHGNFFISNAIDKGAKFIITDKKPIHKYHRSKIIIKKNVLSALLEIAKIKREQYKGVVIGITGSIGKTSVKENLNYFLLSSSYKVFAAIKSYNNNLGVIISLLNMDLNSEFSIFELGTSDFFEIRNLTSIVKPNQTIITNIFPTHLEKLKTTRNIAKEKSDIFNTNYNQNVKLAILSNNNEDEEFIIKKALKSKVENIITYGKNTNSNLKIMKIENFGSESNIILNFNSKTLNFQINNNQLHRLNNILVCLLIFIFNNLDLNKFILLTKNIPLIQGRGLQRFIFFEGKKINLIDESYNASPQSMESCISYFINIKSQNNQKKILILGDMMELGDNAIDFHVNLLNYLSKLNFENVIICGELMNLALKKTKFKNIKYISNISNLLDYLKKTIDEGDLILVKGSNSSLANYLVNEYLLKEGD
mgnify:CR=1 FL=1